MKKLIYLLVFILLPVLQVQAQTYSISFKDNTLKDALMLLEEKTGHKIYFEDTWLEENDKTFTVSFNNEHVTSILNDLLSETSLHFVALDGRIILTKNSIVYDELPNNYFGNDNKIANSVPKKAPKFIEEFTNNSESIIAIGKEKENTTGLSFTLEGVVKNFSKDQVVQDVIVYVKDKNLSVTTDKNGYYRLSLPYGLNIIETKGVGFNSERTKVFVYGDGTFNIEVLEDIEELETVVVNTNKKQNLKETTVGVTKVNVKEIKTIPMVLGERDVLKVATTMPGVSSAGEGALGYNVRGGKVDQNLVMLDDAVIYNPTHFFGIFTGINPYAIGAVNIYKGSMSVEHGGRLSSVIDISSKKIDLNKFSGEASIGPVTGNILLETPIIEKKTGVLFGMRSTYSDWILRSISSEATKKSEAGFYDGMVKIEHKLSDKGKIQATGYLSNDKFSIASDSVYEYNNKLVSLIWDQALNAKNKLITSVSNSQYSFNVQNQGDSNNNFDLGFNLSETKIKLKMNYNYNKRNLFQYGIEGKYYKIYPGYIRPLDPNSIVTVKEIASEQAAEGALFVSDIFKVNKKLSLDIGLRYSFFGALGESTQLVYDNSKPRSQETVLESRQYGKNEVIKTYAVPEVRVSARYLFTPDFSAKIAFNNTVQYIHMLSSNTTASPIDTWTLSNLNIEPQTGTQFSVGLFRNFKDDLYELSLEAYYKKMKNVLDFKTGADLLLNETIETETLIGKGKAYGAELLLKKKKGDLNGWLSYSYARTLLKIESPFSSEQINNGSFFPANHDRPHNLNVIANYKLTKRYSFSLSFNYQTGRPITYPVGKYEFSGEEYVLYSDRNKFRMPDYFRLDLGVNIEGNHKIKKLAHSFWNISVYNVLGRNNPYSIYFINKTGKVEGRQTSIFSMPIPTISYNLKF